MKKRIRSAVSHAGFVGLALSLLAGCQVLPEAKVDPTRNFVLSSPAAAELVATKPVGKYQVGIRPIELAGYLHNRRDIAVRTGANEIRFEEYNRWAEPLETGIYRVLKQQLLSTEAVGGVANYPFAADLKRDYDVAIRVLNCEGALSADGRNITRFNAAYDVIAAGAGGQVVVRRTFTAPEQGWNGKDFGALAGALSEAVARLSEDIAANLPK
ncbi:MAG: PqiC family protein [Nibricoccus sp.]